MMPPQDVDNSKPDPLRDAARQLVLETRNPSVAHLQRHLRLGYRRAAGLIAALEGELVTAMDENGSRRMLDFSGPLSGTSPVRLAVVDVETTGLSPLEHELIGLSIVSVEVDRATGAFLKTVNSYAGHREPGRPLSADQEQIVGLSAALLAGKRLDSARIHQVLEGCELVVAHCASFDRSFLTPHAPALDQFTWACSLWDIDWFGAEQQPHASMAHLTALYDIEESDGTPAEDCRTLIEILSRPLPVSGCTGFAALLATVGLHR